MYVINPKRTLISLKEPYKVFFPPPFFQFQLKRNILDGGGGGYVSLFMQGN